MAIERNARVWWCVGNEVHGGTVLKVCRHPFTPTDLLIKDNRSGLSTRITLDEVYLDKEDLAYTLRADRKYVRKQIELLTKREKELTYSLESLYDTD